MSHNVFLAKDNSNSASNKQLQVDYRLKSIIKLVFHRFSHWQLGTVMLTMWATAKNIS